MAFPFGLEWGHIHDDAAARIGALSNADRQDVPRNSEILDAPSQRERIWRHNAGVALQIDKGLRIEVLRINDRVKHIGEHLELIRHPQVITVAR